jgi:hypothetical protein
MRSTIHSARQLIVLALFTSALAQAQAPPETTDEYGELRPLNEYKDRGEKLGHVSMGPLTNATDTYFDRKSDWTGSSGFNWMIESAPMLQQHIDGGAGSQSNIETNLIGQWSVIDKTDSKRGNVLAWHQYASTLGSRTTTEW